MPESPSNTLKDRVKSFWNAVPCGTRDITAEPGTIEFLRALERQRDDLEPYIREFAEFDRWKGKKVLEVGFGAGVDFVRFARAGADLSGIDLTEAGKEAVDRWLELEVLAANTQVADAENLPFEDNTFDLAYSWGVIHHTPDTPKAAKELLRVCETRWRSAGHDLPQPIPCLVFRPTLLMDCFAANRFVRWRTSWPTMSKAPGPKPTAFVRLRNCCREAKEVIVQTKGHPLRSADHTPPILASDSGVGSSRRVGGGFSSCKR